MAKLLLKKIKLDTLVKIKTGAAYDEKSIHQKDSEIIFGGYWKESEKDIIFIIIDNTDFRRYKLYEYKPRGNIKVTYTNMHNLTII